MASGRNVAGGRRDDPREELPPAWRSVLLEAFPSDAPESCPPPETLAAWCAEERPAAVTQHLVRCDECREDLLVAALCAPASRRTSLVRPAPARRAPWSLAVPLAAAASLALVVGLALRGEGPRPARPVAVTPAPRPARPTRAQPTRSAPPSRTEAAPTPTSPSPEARPGAPDTDAPPVPPVAATEATSLPTPPATDATPPDATPPDAPPPDAPPPDAPPGPDTDSGRRPTDTAPPPPAQGTDAAPPAVTLTESDGVAVRRGGKRVRDPSDLRSGETLVASSRGGIVSTAAASLSLAPDARLEGQDGGLALSAGQLLLTTTTGASLGTKAGLVEASGACLVLARGADVLLQAVVGSVTLVHATGRILLAPGEAVRADPRRATAPQAVPLTAPDWLLVLHARLTRPLPRPLPAARRSWSWPRSWPWSWPRSWPWSWPRSWPWSWPRSWSWSWPWRTGRGGDDDKGDDDDDKGSQDDDKGGRSGRVGAGRSGSDD